jgi:hypothetical protein
VASATRFPDSPSPLAAQATSPVCWSSASRNNYLGGKNAASVKDSLMSKLPGGTSSSDSGYSSGAKGILSDSKGSQFDLGSMKKKVTKQICDKVLAQGKSML